MNYARSIKLLRNFRDITQGELGLAMQMSTGTIKDYERGHREPTKKTLEKIAGAFRVPVGVICFMAMEPEDIDGADMVLTTNLLRSADKKFRHILENG